MWALKIETLLTVCMIQDKSLKDIEFNWDIGDTFSLHLHQLQSSSQNRILKKEEEIKGVDQKKQRQWK